MIPFTQQFKIVFLEILSVEDCIDLTLCEESGNFHLILCQSACLVTANSVNSSHGFAGVESSDQILFIFHFSDSVSEGDRDCEGESFWDSDDNNRDTDNEVIHNFLEIFNGEEWLASLNGPDHQVYDHCCES